MTILRFVDVHAGGRVPKEVVTPAWTAEFPAPATMTVSWTHAAIIANRTQTVSMISIHMSPDEFATLLGDRPHLLDLRPW